MNWLELTFSFFFLLTLRSLQLLLTYSNTDVNLQGDLGNTPVILACSINNCEALSILVRKRLSVAPRAPAPARKR